MNDRQQGIKSSVENMLTNVGAQRSEVHIFDILTCRQGETIEDKFVWCLNMPGSCEKNYL